MRQTRLLDGEYVVNKDDLAQRTRFPDTVARGRDYTTPYRAMLPKNVENLLVAGRHYSATPGGAEDVARDSAVHGDGRGGRRRRGARARQRRAACATSTCRAAEMLRAQGADPGDHPGRTADVPADRAPDHPLERSRERAAPAATASLPLAGIRVIDFTQVMMGPVCTQMLGDYGADVIKIERKGAGDLSRATFEPIAGHDNPVFCSLNRNKRSVALDLKTPSTWRRCAR